MSELQNFWESHNVTTQASRQEEELEEQEKQGQQGQQEQLE